LLLVAVPKFDSWTRHALGNFWHNLQYPIHLHHFNQPVLEWMIRDAGFHVFTRPQGTLSDIMLIVAEK
jgi:hypothetical protein